MRRGRDYAEGPRATMRLQKRESAVTGPQWLLALAVAILAGVVATSALAWWILWS